MRCAPRATTRATRSCMDSSFSSCSSHSSTRRPHGSEHAGLFRHLFMHAICQVPLCIKVAAAFQIPGQNIWSFPRTNPRFGCQTLDCTVTLPARLVWGAECGVALGISVQLQGFNGDGAADGIPGIAVPMQQGINLVGAQEGFKHSLARQGCREWHHPPCKQLVRAPLPNLQQ